MTDTDHGADSYDRLKARYEHLLEISRELNAIRDLDALLIDILLAATDLTHTETASIMLIDPDSGELRFEAALNESGGASSRMDSVVVPLEGSIAGWVVTHGEPQLVADVHDDPRWFSGVDQSTDHVTRDLLAVPLKTRDEIIGCVQAINKQGAETWTGDDVETLGIFANQAAIAIQTARLFEAEVRRQRLEQELTIAHRIQMSLIPDDPPALPGWDIAAYYRPASQVGGDFYDFFPLDGGDRVGLVIADVSDKGVPAAIFMAMSRTVIRATALSARDPALTLTWSNNLIVRDSEDSGVFVTVFYADLDGASGYLRYANGGHNNPIWRQAATGDTIELHTRGPILGIFEDIDIEQKAITLETGDIVVFYTDGVTEAMNEEREEFLPDRLHTLIDAQADATAQGIVTAIVSAVDAHAGDAPQFDDLTLFVVKRVV